MTFTLRHEIDVVALLTAVLAGFAVWVAWRQLSTMALQTRANTLLVLDQRWESEPLLSSRAELNRLIAEITTEVTASHATLADEARDIRIFALFADQLEELREKEMNRYLGLLLVCGFFETVGYAAKAGYVPTDDVIALFGVSIAALGSVFELHILRLQYEPGGDRRQYANFLWLVEQERRAHG